MSDLAPILQSFFLDKMITQKHASQHTIRSYRDTFRLFPGFAQQTTGTPPWELDISQLDAGLITSFLRWLQAGRGNSPRTRNARLAAIRSLFRYAALRAPDNAAVIQRVLAIEASRTDTTVINWLTNAESDALLAVPDRGTWTGRRDYALLLVALRTGLRVSELTQLTRRDLHMGTGAHVRCALLTELSDVAAAQEVQPSRRPIGGLPERSRSPGRGSPVAGLIAAETGHTVLNHRPSFSSLPIFDAALAGLERPCSRRDLLRHPNLATRLP